ncbi:MAG TPA: hypothetical protein VGZ02_01200 [Candidatus Baltobacteraceae bacterium]|jgi:ABC-type Na+ transport system ATPase subunit NatA|nr:hypothetical protein [Candidatus Baltobacteraceae bacterium]
MPLLEMRSVTYVHHGRTLTGPVTLALEERGRLAYACGDAFAACALSLIAAAIVKPSTGTVFIGAFDTRVQPVHSKRIAGYVQHEAGAHDFTSFTRYIEYRAALWGLPRAESIVRARALLTKLDGVHEQFAYPLVGALIAMPQLLVLDRPQAAYALSILEAAGGCAIFSTHADERDAERFAAACGVPA